MTSQGSDPDRAGARIHMLYGLLVMCATAAAGAFIQGLYVIGGGLTAATLYLVWIVTSRGPKSR